MDTVLCQRYLPATCKQRERDNANRNIAMWMYLSLQRNEKVIWDQAASRDGITTLSSNSREPRPLRGKDTHGPQHHGNATPWRIFFQTTDTKCITPNTIMGTLPQNASHFKLM